MICDNETGQCTISSVPVTSNPLLKQEAKDSVTVHYIGDPMCSWCWGIYGSLKALETWCREHGFRFVLTNGGLRAGGGDEWNSAFKRFLREEWLHINSVTGQPFNFSLLEQDDFNYDTEPACRAVVSASIIRPDAKLQFFHETQRKFYTESVDPKEASFYRSICEKIDINFEEFKAIFTSQLSANETYKEFIQARQFGVNSFPTILLEKSGVIKRVASGYINEHDIIKNITAINKEFK